MLLEELELSVRTVEVDVVVVCSSRVTRVLVDVGVSWFVTVVLLVDVVVDAAKVVVDIAANTHATNTDFLLIFINLSFYRISYNHIVVNIHI